MKCLMVHLDGSDRDATRLAVVSDLANRFESQVTGVFATVPPLLTMPYGEFGTAGVAGLVQTLVEVQAQWRTQARVSFDGAPLGARGRWADVSAEPVISAVASQMLLADLSVLGQHDPDDRDHAVPSDFVPAVLTATGRPAIVLPYAGTFDAVGREVLVAWKSTPSSARALAAALPLLQRARSVHVIGEPTHDIGSGTPLTLERCLRWHGIEAQWHRFDQAEPPDIGELLLSRAADFGSDLLVMGCYGHSRAWELVLGGATRTVLGSMTLPVLMCH